jgi:hypothetical protein
MELHDMTLTINEGVDAIAARLVGLHTVYKCLLYARPLITPHG